MTAEIGERGVIGRRYDVAISVFSAIYALIFAIIPSHGFRDRENYLNYAENASEILHTYISAGLLRALTNEPIWLAINTVLGTIFPGPVVVSIIAFFAAFGVAFFLLSQVRRPIDLVIVTIILLAPSVFRTHLIQLRQGLAISVFLLALMVRIRGARWGILMAVPLIHSSFFLVIPLVALREISIKLRFSGFLTLLILLTVIATFVFSIGTVSSLLRARQASILETYGSDISPFSLMMWTVLFMSALFQGKRFIREHVLEVSTLTFFFWAFFYMPPVARGFQATLVLSLLAISRMRRDWLLATSCVFFIYVLAQYLVRTSQPWFGYAV